MSAPSLRLVVARTLALTPDIRGLDLRHPAGLGLPSFAPGSHLVLDCAGRLNAYSLTGDGLLPDTYTISVRLDPRGGGGSRWIHGLRDGDVVACHGPRDAFAPVVEAKHHLMVAGGIGITPMLSHLRAARFWGRSTNLIYAVADREPVPHGADLDGLASGGLTIVHGRAALHEAAGTALAAQPLGTHLYVCGPAGLIDAVLALAEQNGWPPERCHAERFGAAETAPGQPFTVHLRRSNRHLTVPGDVSLLDALAVAGLAWPAMCRRGVCGECRMEGAAGTILHHDLVLSAAEHAAGTCLMPCVSRAEGVLTLDH